MPEHKHQWSAWSYSLDAPRSTDSETGEVTLWLRRECECGAFQTRKENDKERAARRVHAR